MSGRVLLFGGAGFIGNILADKLVLKNQEVLILGRSQSIVKNKFITFISIDFYDYNSWKDILRIDDTVVFLIPCHMPSRSDSKKIESEYLASFRLLLKTSSTVKIKKFVFLSSGGAIYGESDKVFNESDVPRPKSDYGKLKLKIENILLEYAPRSIFSVVIARPSNVYGETQNPKISFGAVTTFFHKISNDLTIEIFGDLGICKDYLHVDDLADALVELCLSNHSGIYNLGLGKTYTLGDIISLIEKKLGKKAICRSYPLRESDVYKYSLDITKAKSELGFKPSIDLESGINRYLNNKR